MVRFRRQTYSLENATLAMELTLSDRVNIAEGTMGLWLRPERTVRFTAGQFGDFTLGQPPYTDSRGNTRTFSFASAPDNDRILIATRLRDSAFKRSLTVVPLGATFQLMGPMGGFTLHKDAHRPAVFLAGGIGITPVRSIVEHATQRRLAHRICVFYSNQTRARVAFLEDFEAWARTNDNLRFVPTLTQERTEGWAYEHGPIDQQMIAKYVPDLGAPVYYIVGPPAMVRRMKGVLEGIGIHELQIKSEDFAGY